MASPPGYTTPAKEKAPRRGASKELLGSSKYLLSTKTSTSWPTKESVGTVEPTQGFRIFWAGMGGSSANF